MDAYFYSMTKRENATTQPSGSGNHVDNIVLKEPTSIMEPELRIATYAGWDPVGYNYCYIPAFERYYWVRDWIAEPGYNWVAVCKVDVLATYAAAIGNSTQYILRSSNASNGDIIDELYPATAGVQTLVNTHNGIWDATNGASPNARYILGIVNDRAEATMGCVSYYVLDATGLSLFMAKLMGTVPTGYQDGDGGLTEDMYRAMYNPIQYVVSCIFCPIMPGTGASVTTIDVGPTLNITNLSGVHILSTAALPAKTGSITIPKHPQAAVCKNAGCCMPYRNIMARARPRTGWRRRSRPAPARRLCSSTSANVCRARSSDLYAS